jgi:myo-inositol-1(or 4)-monophosphatase
MKMTETSKFKNFLNQIITRAGQITLDYRKELASISIEKKSAKDLVTEADIAVEKYLVKEISTHYPDHAILGEETGAHQGNEYRWVIDPIDGTTSFICDQPFFSVSVALEKSGETILAAVNAPVLGELFEAQKGCGAYLNGKRINVTDTSQMIDSVLATGFACVRANLENDNLPYFNNIIRNIRDIRRFGSAAIDLSYVAAGRLEGFWELNLNIYDVAAGMLLVTEAGGTVTNFANTTEDIPSNIVATNGIIHDQLLTLLNEAKTD